MPSRTRKVPLAQKHVLVYRSISISLVAALRRLHNFYMVHGVGLMRAMVLAGMLDVLMSDFLHVGNAYSPSS